MGSGRAVLARCSWLPPLLLLLLAAALPQHRALEGHERARAFIGYHEQHSNGDGSAAGAARQGPAARAAADDILAITTSHGQIRLRLNASCAPKTVALVKQLARRSRCDVCTFYRHEPVPDNWGVGGFFGPPYALLQGSLAAMSEEPPPEGRPVVARGDACIIPSSREFFIATAGHEEWGTAHTVFGHVADEASWRVIGAIPYAPFTTRTDEFNITTRWLTQEAHVPFKLSLLADGGGDASTAQA